MSDDFIDPFLIAAVQQQESGGNPNAVSSKGAVGAMQTLPTTLSNPGYGVTPAKDDSDAERQRVGQDYLQAMHDKYGDQNLALAAYNWGPRNVDNWIKNGKNPADMPAETKNYIQKVNQNYQQLKSKQLPAGTQMASNDTYANDATSSDNSSVPSYGSISADLRAAANATTDNQSTIPTTAASKGSISADLRDAAAQSDANQAAQAAQAKANPSLSEQYNSDVNTARNRIINSLASGRGGFDALYDVGGAVGTGVSNAIGQTINAYTPQSVKNALTETGQAIEKYTPQSVKNALTDVKNTASTAYNELSPDWQRRFGDIGDIYGGIASVEGVNASTNLLSSASSSALGAAKNLVVKDSDTLAKNTLLKTAADANALRPENIDTTQIVPGSKPTLAQTTGDANIASIEKQLKKNPEYNSDFAALENSNENARQQYFTTSASGTAQDVQTLKAQRKSLTEPLYEQAKTQPLNPTSIQPVLANFDKAIQEVGSETDAGKALLKIKSKIQSALPDTKTVSTGLLDAQGNPITKELPKSNPTQSPLVQVFKEERDKAADDAIGEDAYANAIKTHVQPLIRQLGAALESQSEPFAKAQNLYRTLSPEINSKQWLQNLDLKDKFGNFSLSKVDNAYENALSLRNSEGFNPAKDLSDTQLQTMKNLRDDLLNRDQTIKLGNSVKTPNVLQQSPSLVKKVIHESIGAGIGAGAAALTGGNPWVGGFVGGTTMRGLESAAAKKSLATGSSLTNFVLNPEQYKNYLMTGIRP